MIRCFKIYDKFLVFIFFLECVLADWCRKTIVNAILYLLTLLTRFTYLIYLLDLLTYLLDLFTRSHLLDLIDLPEVICLIPRLAFEEPFVTSWRPSKTQDPANIEREGRDGTRYWRRRMKGARQ